MASYSQRELFPDIPALDPLWQIEQADLIWQHQTTGLISVWLMKGRQQVPGIVLSPPADREPTTTWRIVGGGVPRLLGVPA